MKRICPSIHILSICLLYAVCLLPVSVQALTYMPRMDHAQWISRSHVLNCSLIQPIPDFGRAVFDVTAGEELRFYLEAPGNPFEPGQASLTSRASTWNPTQPEQSMAIVSIDSSRYPVRLDKTLATHMLSELYLGKSPRFLRSAWYAESQSIEVGLSSATFRSAYLDYRNCLSRLLPVGFDQIKKSRVHFAVDDWVIDEEARAWLAIMVRYLTEAPDVEQLYIDGHTDDTHSHSYNRALSQRRAESVRDHLVAHGVSPNLISVRFHGERFPAATNKTAEGRAKNRRVTLRVELAVDAQQDALARR